MMQIQRWVVESLVSSVFNICLHSLCFSLAFLYTNLTFRDLVTLTDQHLSFLSLTE